MKRTISLILTFTFCLTAFFGCEDTRHRQIPGEMTNLEKTIAKEWEVLEDFEFIRITVDTAEDAEQEKGVLNIRYSYTGDAGVVVNDSTFEISYDDYLILYTDNEGRVVYNTLTDDAYPTLITDIESDSLAIVKSTIEWYWRTIGI